MSLLRRDSTLSIEQRRQIDQICLAFEDQWLSGDPPVIEPFLNEVPLVARDVLLSELLLLDLDYRRGLTEPLRVEDYLCRFPAHVGLVRSAYDQAVRSRGAPRFVPGTLIGRYRVRGLIGVGAFASVYLAWDDQLQREVAVKVPHRRDWERPEDRRRWLEEARAVARVKHPAVVAVHDAAELDNGTVFLVMQYVSGQSLRRLMGQGRLSVPDACRIVAEAAEAIDAAHQAGVVHRDLKPSNILIDERGRVHVCDFGLALRSSPGLRHAGEWAGTPAYMSPEQLHGDTSQLDGRTDIWTLGVILYELLGGRHPFEELEGEQLSRAILHGEPPPLRGIDGRIPRGAERVCARCLAKRPADRFATAAKVSEALRRLDRQPVTSRLWLPAGLLLTLGMVAALLAARLPVADPAPAAAVPLWGTVDLLVWDPDTMRRQGVRLIEPGAVPLRAGDRVRVQVQLNQPAFVYLVWLDTHGVPLPVFPWQDGQWSAPPSDDRPRQSLALPAEQDAGWPMRVDGHGVETLLLLARRQPLPPDLPLAEILTGSLSPPLVAPARAVWFHAGRPQVAAVGTSPRGPPRNRDPLLQHPVPIDDPLLKLHQRIAATLEPHFEVIHAVSFPVAGD